MAELESQLQEDEELLMEILIRLPVKSLVRFTCVCKYWQSLIQSPKFITMHYSTRSKLSEYDSILSFFKPGCSISILNYQDLTFETAFKFRPAVAFDPLRFEIYHRDIITGLSIVGPCNGLFLIQVVKGFEYAYEVRMLWNPATRELFKLPEIPNGNCSDFGFGFDAVTHDYKIVGLYGYSDDLVKDNSIVWLYSLAANSWRRAFNACMYLTHLCFYTRFNQAGSSCNGRMHNWILNDDCRGQLTHRLLSFDMVDEVFVETPLPSDAPIIHGFLYQGSNRVYPSIFWIRPNVELHVWDLQQYGPNGVWNKVLNIKFPKVSGPSYMVLRKNKDIVFSNILTVSSFNFTSQQLKSLSIPANDCMLAYTESLVSISRFVRQSPPTMDHSSDESVSVALLLIDKGPVVDDQQMKFFPNKGISVSVFPPTRHLSEESVPLQLGDERPVEDDQQVTQQMKCLRIPADDNLAYTDESLVSIAKSVLQPPTMDHPSSDESVPLQLGDEGTEDDQHVSETTMIHQMLPKVDDSSDDDSSTDSAFLTPHITAFTNPMTIYIDYETDLEFSALRRNEVERLSKLPYCLHEINKPMIPVPAHSEFY